MTWGDTYNRLKAKGLDANDAAFRADQSEARKHETFPQPRRNDGGEPCGECHIQPGETCDICGASHPSPSPNVGNAEAEAMREKAISNARERNAAYRAIQASLDDFELIVERINASQIDRACATAMQGAKEAKRALVTSEGSDND